MTIKQPFFPKYGSNQAVAVAAAAEISLDRDCKQVRVVNTGANKGYFRTYSSLGAASNATAADCVVPAGMAVTVSKGEHDRMSTFAAVATTFEVMAGEGF